MARKTLIRGMLSVASDNRTDDGETLHHRRHFRKQLTDLNAGNACLNRIEFAANVRGRVHFQIPHVLMRRPAREENVDDAFAILRRFRCFVREQVAQIKSAQRPQRECADAQKSAARHSVAKSGFTYSLDGEHEWFPCAAESTARIPLCFVTPHGWNVMERNSFEPSFGDFSVGFDVQT